MIIAISPIPTCCRSNWTMPFSKSAGRRLPELPDAKRARYESDGAHGL